jgi:hypothetical protein
MPGPMLRTKVLVPFLVRPVQLAVEPAMLPLRHRHVMHGLMCLAEISVLLAMLRLEVTMLGPVLCLEVLVSSFVRPVQLLVKPAVLPLRHRNVVHRSMRFVQIQVLFTMLCTQFPLCSLGLIMVLMRKREGSNP